MSRTLNQEVINELKELPIRLQGMGQRTAKTLNALFGRIHPDMSDNAYSLPVDILVCVKDAIADPSINLEQKNKIKVKEAHSFFFFGDQAQITQVILNIIENALHAVALKEYGEIFIWAENNSLFIRDNGEGISKRNLPNIFDEFFSTKKTLGQGLAFCRQIILEHNGTIQCESKENHFTLFEIAFTQWR
jgi:signal transduction histidine kinase